MKKTIICIGMLLSLMTSSALAIDKKALENHLRRALLLPLDVPMTVGDAEPTGVAGIRVATVTIEGAGYPVYLSKDEKFYIWGKMFDLSVDPDVERWSRISLNKVHMKGSPTAPVTVVEFSDMQCPNCQTAHEILKERLHKVYRPEQVRLVFKHFPLSKHLWSEPAAVASECAGEQKSAAFWGFADRFFNQASSITAQNVRAKAFEFAGELKLNKTTLTQCMDKGEPLTRIRADKQEGVEAGVNATPTFIINGRVVRGGSFDAIKAVIDEKLAEAKKR